jgi:ribosomal protein S18 acetylase RimI-like enzyme/predicted double-glycine peptidase
MLISREKHNIGMATAQKQVQVADGTLAKLSAVNKSGEVEEFAVSKFNYSRDWERDVKDIMKLEQSAFPESIQSEENDIKSMLSDKSSIAVVTRDKEGHIVGMTYAIGWPYIEKEANEWDSPKSEGGEKEAFLEVPKLVGKLIGREMPRDNKTSYVYSISVMPEHQHKHIGTAMAQALMAEAKKAGTEVLVSHSMVGTGSVEVFEKTLGLKRAREDAYPDWYETGISTLLLARSLTDGDSLKNVRRPEVIEQTNGYNCGPTTMKVLLNYHNAEAISIDEIEKIANTRPLGTFPEDMIRTAKVLGFKVEAKSRATVEELVRKSDEGNPAIVLVTLHYLPLLPDSFDYVPEKLWYGWQDALRKVAHVNKVFDKALSKFEDVHYLLMAGHDEKNLEFVDVSYGKKIKIPKDEFDDRWFGVMGESQPKTLYDHWMMTISQGQ